MKLTELQELANFYGYEINDISHRPPYNQRKTKTYGIFDRRTNQLVASYASANPKLKKYFDRFK